MDKMAIFVEGQTEQEFVRRLVVEIAGHKHVHVDAVRASHGNLLPRQYVAVSASRPVAGTKYYFLIWDCGNDSRVLSDIRERYDELTNQGYREIIGIRDVYPFDNAVIPTIRSDFRGLVKKRPIEPSLILGVREVEAWFIAEHTHFLRRHAALTQPSVTAALGYDPQTHDVTTIPHPAQDLDNVYRTVGLAYTKAKKSIERLVEQLDYALIYLALILRIPDLNRLIEIIDTFLSPPLVPAAPAPVVAGS